MSNDRIALVAFAHVEAAFRRRPFAPRGDFVISGEERIGIPGIGAGIFGNRIIGERGVEQSFLKR